VNTTSKAEVMNRRYQSIYGSRARCATAGYRRGKLRYACTITFLRKCGIEDSTYYFFQNFIKDVWTSKYKTEETKNATLTDFLYTYLKKRFGIHTMIAEWGMYI